MLKNLYPINDKLILFIRCKIQAFYLGNKFFNFHWQDKFRKL